MKSSYLREPHLHARVRTNHPPIHQNQLLHQWSSSLQASYSKVTYYTSELGVELSLGNGLERREGGGDGELAAVGLGDDVQRAPLQALVVAVELNEQRGEVARRLGVRARQQALVAALHVAEPGADRVVLRPPMHRINRNPPLPMEQCAWPWPCEEEEEEEEFRLVIVYLRRRGGRPC